MTRTNALMVLVVLLMASAGFADWKVLKLSNNLSRDEHTSCVIEAQGLPAGHELAAVMSNLHALLIVPETARQRAAQRLETPLQRYLTGQLNGHLAKYQKAETTQPHTRRC